MAVKTNGFVNGLAVAHVYNDGRFVCVVNGAIL